MLVTISYRFCGLGVVKYRQLLRQPFSDSIVRPENVSDSTRQPDTAPLILREQVGVYLKNGCMRTVIFQIFSGE